MSKIKEKRGNIFLSQTEALVNSVNCVGVMGNGLALQFKKKYSKNYKEYKERCERKQMNVGNVFVFQNSKVKNPKYIINFPTKDHWRDEARFSYIEAGLFSLGGAIEEYKILSIAIPALGCGLGKLEWKVVRKMIIISLENFRCLSVELYRPLGI